MCRLWQMQSYVTMPEVCRKHIHDHHGMGIKDIHTGISFIPYKVACASIGNTLASTSNGLPTTWSIWYDAKLTGVSPRDNNVLYTHPWQPPALQLMAAESLGPLHTESGIGAATSDHVCG